MNDAQLAREMRLDKHLTIDEIAAAMGISREDYLAIERGENSRGAKNAQDTVLKMLRRWDRPEDISDGIGVLNG
jgi:transcriptional regulator with XRE-family HTH domain